MLPDVSSPDARITRLQQTSLFGATSDETVEFVLTKAPRVEVAAGRWFFREGERGSAIYWLEAGEVAITRRRDEREIELRRLGTGDFFGEVALFDFGPRSASVRALSDCRALEITGGILREIAKRDLEQYTLLTMNLGRELSRRLRSVEALLLQRDAGWDADRPTPST